MKLSKILNKLLPKQNKTSVLIFCDPGVDDALMLWQSLSSQQLNILGIIAGAGNTNRTQTISNAQDIIAVTGKGDIKVYAGCERPLDIPISAMSNGLDVYGDDGLNGLELPQANADYVVTDGIDFAYEQICQQSVCIISTGGLTDIYLLLFRLAKKAPDKLKNISGIFMMAGVVNISQEANAPITGIRQSEFNILFDIKASKGAFDLAALYNIPIFLAPLDLTHSILCSQEDARPFKELNNLVANYFYKLLYDVPSHYAARYGKGPDGTMRQPIHDLHASNALLHPEQYRGNWHTINVNDQGQINIINENQGNVFLLQHLYTKRTLFFQDLLKDLQQFNNLTYTRDNKMDTKVIVFDLDDTLWDCSQHYRHHINGTRVSFALERWTEQEFNDFGYKNREHMFQHMFGDKAIHALDHFYQTFESQIPNKEQARLLHNVEELLKSLRTKNIVLIAWSNTEDRLVQRLIDHFQIRPYFHHIMGSNGCKSKWQDLKPNLQLFEDALQKLNLMHIDRRQILFVGDSLTSDIQCGHNAKCMTAWYNPLQKSITTPIKPHIVISSLIEIESLVFNSTADLSQKDSQTYSVGFHSQFFTVKSNQPATAAAVTTPADKDNSKHPSL